MTFMQLIEVKTSRYDELNELMEGWMAATEGKRTATHALLTGDRDHPGTYLQLVEFPSYEEAMRNSELPETNDFAGRLQELCDEPPVFHNLDVLRDQKL
ncbi:hypothetical protein [Prauserella muralis]|uniref:Uncharacterized protein n=1 Tax=Prauserella muralis TaxID=588067 RepID=A0A2V4BB42_9PSEU|nr:hypothetical protein [Prauserella muralis]PXY32366.1 hypothetical protein BAY60_08855 [Prauserella muralis]TWE23949.1 hypothetical protein FHX69_5253 [Prauserella muralis]